MRHPLNFIQFKKLIYKFIYQLIYKKYIGDGDSKGYAAVCKSMMYGGNVFIEREECVSHITKRMESGLREMVRWHKGLYKHINLRYFVWLTKCSLIVATIAQIFLQPGACDVEDT